MADERDYRDGVHVRGARDDRGENTCKHGPCSCRADGGEDYCGVSCANAGDTTQIECGCGHPGCSADF